MNADDATDPETVRNALAAEAEQDPEGVWHRLENAGVLKRFKVHEYRCTHGCELALVIRLGDVVLMRTRDYRQRPRTNLRRSVPRGREKNTLNGIDHWPGHVFDVARHAGQTPDEWGQPVWGDRAYMDLNCRHHLRSVAAADVLATIRDTPPGRPGKPSLLS